MSLEPEDFELCADVTDQFEIQPHEAGAVLSIRLDSETARRLFAAAEAEGLSIIEYARRGLIERLDRAGARAERKARVS